MSPPSDQDTVAKPIPGPATEQALAEIFAAALDRDHVEIDDDFFMLGGASLQAAVVFSQIEERFGIKLPMALLVEHATPRALATKLVDQAPPSTTIVSIQTAGTRSPLFLVHPLDGSVLRYRDLAALLPDQPVYGIQYPHIGQDPLPQRSVEELATQYVADLRRIQPHGPYTLGGYSFGGFVALDMARQLTEAGARVAMLFILDTALERLDAALPNKLSSFLAGFDAVPKVEWPLYIYHKLRRLISGRRDGPYLAIESRDENLPTAVRELQKTLRLTAAAFTPQPYGGPVAFVSAIPKRRMSEDVIVGPWRPLLSGTLTHHAIHAEHLLLFDEPALSECAGFVRTQLDRLQAAR